MQIVLASASPRRRELLELLGIRGFRILPADTDETVTKASPEDTVRHIALQKARKAAEDCLPEDVIIAADTLVYLDGEALGKPVDACAAKAMLARLSGVSHSVYTGVALRRGAEEKTFFEKTDVFFRPMTAAEIDAYVRTGEPMDKAGAYGAQGCGAAFIERIEGDFFNVVGLPVCRLVVELRGFGLDLAGFSA